MSVSGKAANGHPTIRLRRISIPFRLLCLLQGGASSPLSIPHPCGGREWERVFSLCIIPLFFPFSSGVGVWVCPICTFMLFDFSMALRRGDYESPVLRKYRYLERTGGPGGPPLHIRSSGTAMFPKDGAGQSPPPTRCPTGRRNVGKGLCPLPPLRNCHGSGRMARSGDRAPHLLLSIDHPVGPDP